MTTSIPQVVVICGGVGAARFLRGLVEVVPPSSITAIVNVADDFVIHGLHVSPDLDTIMYTLADAIDTERGWGLRNETWRAMESLERYGQGAWFSLGDQDLATHLQRTARRNDGATLSEVTAELHQAWDVEVTVLPVSNDPISTRVTRADTGEEIALALADRSPQHLQFVARDDLTRAVDTPVVRGDASALRRDTGWEPEIPFDKTLDDVLADARARL